LRPPPASGPNAEEWNCIQARRALLREQLERVASQLPWLSDPSLIPETAIAPLVGDGDIELAAFSLAAWMLVEILRGADEVNLELGWRQAFERNCVPASLQDSVARAVLLPAARHAPGLFAMAEIVCVIPKLSVREGIPAEDWSEIVERSGNFASRFALGNTAMQVMLRCYLSHKKFAEDGRAVRSLDPAKLRLDEEMSLTTVTPLNTLLQSAHRAAERSGYGYVAPCVAISAHTTDTVSGRSSHSVFDAIWSCWVHTADRLVFSRFDPSLDAAWIRAKEDADHESEFDSIAAQRRAMLSTIAADPYPEDIAGIFASLLEPKRLS
jgi:hypothetical protein